MKKSIFVESVYNRIYGGRPSTDFSVLMEDIVAWLPAVVNYAMTKGFYTQKNTENNGDIPTHFYKTFENLTILKDDNKKQYINVPATLVAMPSNRGLRNLIDNCDNVLTPLSDSQMSNIKYWLNIFKGEKFYRLRGDRIWLYNLSPLAKKMNLDALISADELGDDEELPIPAGLESEALEMCFEFATGIRKLPVDRKNDDRDIN